MFIDPDVHRCTTVELPDVHQYLRVFPQDFRKHGRAPYVIKGTAAICREDDPPSV